MIAPAAKAADWFRPFLAWDAAYRQVSPDVGNGAGTVPGNSGACPSAKSAGSSGDHSPPPQYLTPALPPGSA
jgi:hypothetical protein